MKRLRIWINSFTLFQQFVTICLLAAFTITFFFAISINDNLRNFEQNQMYSYIHRAQEEYINSDFVTKDTNVTHYVYSLKREVFLTDVQEQFDILVKIDPRTETDSFVEKDDVTYLYAVKSVQEEGYSLVTILSQDYVSSFEDALINGVVNISLYVIFGIIIILMIWVFTLIKPLNQIRNYINRVKIGKSEPLVIKRQDEIGEVAQALVDMNSELAKQQRIREEMIQNISHDLKTPIATIKSYSESIKDGIYPYDTLEKSIDVILEHANRLEKKVYSLIEFNKCEYLKDEDKESTTLINDIISKTILSSKVLRNDISIETNLDPDIYFHGQEDPWRIVIENLLDNSLRYAKSKVTINLYDGLLEIFNDGPLMEQDRIEKLFKPYEKGTGGNFGLGLSIVKKIADTYGYVVSGENMNDGVIFRVYLPKANKKGTVV